MSDGGDNVPAVVATANVSVSYDDGKTKITIDLRNVRKDLARNVVDAAMTEIGLAVRHA